MLKRLTTRFLPLMIAAMAALVSIYPNHVFADVPYQTYYKDNYNQLFEMQAAYTPAGVIGRELFITDPSNPNGTIFSPLKQPQDLFIDQKDHLYIADTGNNRIIHLDASGKLIRILDFPDSPLNRPQGLFVDLNGDIYIADTGNHRVLRLNAEGKLLRQFDRPESKLIPEAFKFDPIKLVVDKRGFLYIATLGGYQGLLQLDPNGEFQSFFGANKTGFSFTDSIKRLLYSSEMYEREISKLPGSIASTDKDADGFIYTVTKEVRTGQLKKLNIAGLDQLAGKGEFADTLSDGSYGEYVHRAGRSGGPQLHDLTVDGNGNITVVDSKLNIVSQYDGNGNLLFFWGGELEDTTTKLGIVKIPSAIETNAAGELFILDSENNIVQTYRLSEFGALVHKANQLTQDGRYEESEPLWLEVNRLHAYYTPAILGLAKAAYKKGEYERAQALFKQAGWAQGYSDSFWQNRLLWFQSNFGLFMNVLFGAIILYFLVKFGARRLGWNNRKKKREADGHPLIGQLKHVFYVMKHPIDGFHAIRYEQKGSLFSSLIILVLAIASYAVMRAGISFIFNPSIIINVEIITILIQFIVIWLSFVICNYLISSLHQGEGRFRDVFYGSAYALFPFILCGVPLTLLSNVMTLSEQSIFSFLELGLYGWVALLIFWKVQGIQNYSVGETIINLLLSLLTMFIGAVLLFIVFSLSSELINFIYSVYQEVTIR